jgi:hypothetical protein
MKQTALDRNIAAAQQNIRVCAVVAHISWSGSMSADNVWSTLDPLRREHFTGIEQVRMALRMAVTRGLLRSRTATANEFFPAGPKPRLYEHVL